MLSERSLYKMRMKPEDFVVEELINLKKSDSGSFSLYRLVKKELDTYEALKIISRKAGVPLKAIGYSGLKDKHSIAVQHITVPKKYRLSLKERNIKLEYLFNVDRKLTLGSHTGNRFTITLRRMKKQTFENLLNNLDFLRAVPVPNYFDSQRFGSLRGSRRFIVEEIARGRYEEALKIYLTSRYRKEKGYIKEIKDKIKVNWGSWSELKQSLKLMKRYENFLDIVSYLEKREDYFGGLKLIRRHLMKIFSSAYQSYMWNEALKRILVENLGTGALKEVEYLAGSLYFIKKGYYENFFEEFEGRKLRLPHRENPEPIYQEFLAGRGLKMEDFDILEEFGAAFQKKDRDMFFRAENIRVENKGKEGKGYFLTLSFSLPKGSYATAFLKALAAA